MQNKTETKTIIKEVLLKEKKKKRNRLVVWKK